MSEHSTIIANTEYTLSQQHPVSRDPAIQVQPGKMAGVLSGNTRKNSQSLAQSRPWQDFGTASLEQCTNNKLTNYWHKVLTWHRLPLASAQLCWKHSLQNQRNARVNSQQLAQSINLATAKYIPRQRQSKQVNYTQDCFFRRAAWENKMKQLPTIAHYIYDATIPFLNAGQTLCCIQYHNLYANHSPQL